VGLQWSVTAGALQLSVEGHAVGSRHVPDRARPALTETGAGAFTRGELLKGAWRGHVIVWRGRDVIKAEGDPNYLSLRQDGAVTHGVRDYAELGLTRRFAPAPGVDLFAAFRLHRIESHYEYSYRIAARVHLRRVL
jgi:hypothetical protein